MKSVSREQALKALFSLDDFVFGHDKGSGEMYCEWAEHQGLCPEWDGESDVKEEDLPPGFFELFLALGIQPQEIIDVLHVNPKCFPEEMCKAYGVTNPQQEG